MEVIRVRIVNIGRDDNKDFKSLTAALTYIRKKKFGSRDIIEIVRFNK